MGTVEKMLEGFEPLADTEAINTLASPEKYAMLRLDQLVAYEGNREVEPEKAELMAESLREQGQLQPILARPSKDGFYEICAGHNRYLGQCYNARHYPDVAEYQLLKAIIKDMGDEEMEVNNAIANLYMDPPASPERARLYERLAKHVPAMRAERPERYAGVPTAQIVAEAARDLGAATSRATVNRALKAAREREEADEALASLDKAWQPEALSRAIRDRDIIRLAALEPRVQRTVKRDFEAHGRKKAYLDERLACTNALDAEELMFRSVEGIVKETERLLRIRRLGFYVEPGELCKVHALLEELAALDEAEG